MNKKDKIYPDMDLKPEPVAKQASEIAVLSVSFKTNRNGTTCSEWRYCTHRKNGNECSSYYRTKEEAIEIAFKNGFRAVRLPDGSFIKKIDFCQKGKEHDS